MISAKTLIRRTVKVIFWIIISVILLSVILAVLINFPSIQTKIIQKATTFISNKTHTKVELEKVNISFPKSIVIEELYLEDTQNDTLVYAGLAKINIALYDLFSSKITINSFSLKNATVNLYNSKTDKVFNYNFLTTAFSDSTAEKKPDVVSSAAWAINLDKIMLQDIRFFYNDNYAAMNVSVEIDKLELNVEQIDFKKSVYKVDKLLLDGLSAVIQQTPTSNSSTSDTSIVMPNIFIQGLELSNAIVQYADSVQMMSVLAIIDQCKLKEGNVDLETELLSLASIDLSKSDIRYHDFKPKLDDEPSISTTTNNWKVSVDKMQMDDNSFTYRVGNNPEKKNEFNPEYLAFNSLWLTGSDFYYDRDLTKVSVHEFMAIVQNHFVINSLAANFSMDAHSISAQALKLTTPNSTIDADFSLHFPSLDAFVENYNFSNLKLEMRNVRFKSPDVLYFSQALSEQPFFQNTKNTTSILGNINGPMNHLTGKNLIVKTGENTLLETDFNITGLPDLETAFFDFPNLKLHSGKNDIIMMAGTSIPESIELPKNIDLDIAFKGKMKDFETTANLKSSFGDANLTASIDTEENFNGKVNLNQLNFGLLLKDTLLYGPVSLTAEAVGQSLDINTIKAKIKAEATQLYLNQYNYQNLVIDGAVDGKQFEGTVNLDDENAVFDFNGLVSLVSGEEKFNFKLDMLGADLQKLHFVDKDVRISFVAEAGLSGGTVNKMNGTAGISDIIVVSENKTYRLESLLAASVNEAKKSELNINSALIGMKYSGTISPIALADVLTRFINNYFPLSDSIAPATQNEQSKFNFEIQLHNHPILSDLLLPGLNEFIPGMITGSFDSQMNDLKLNASLKKIVYGTTEIEDVVIDVNSDHTALNYSISTQSISNAQMSLSNLIIGGKMTNNQLTSSVSSIDEKLFKKLLVSSLVTKEKGNFKLAINPSDFYLMNKQWDIAADNYVEFGKQGFLVHNMNMYNAQSQVNIASLNDRFNDDLNIVIKNFEISDLADIMTKESTLINGTINGNALLKRVNESYGIIADASISKLFINKNPLGDLSIKAENTIPERFNIDANLSGADNNLSVKGFYIPNGGANSINIKAVIESLSMKTLEAFSMGQISEASGMISGEFLVAGNTNAPGITGQMVFNNVFMKPAFMNNRIELKNERIQLKNDGIYFNNFTFLDSEQNTASVNGVVKMQKFSDINFNVSLSSKDFLLFNTTVNDNDVFFGRMIIDSKIDVTGPMELPVVNARLKMKKGSGFTFVVPEDQLTTDKGEDVVEFNSGMKLNPILFRIQQTERQKSKLKGFDVSSIVEIDKDATLRLLMDPASTDSLVVKGEAALSFSMDPSGIMSLTGAYNLSEGSYLVSLESIIKKQFDIDGGSTIIWNGDPLDANININARHTVQVSPYDLVADQLVGLSNVEKGAYKQRYPFEVMLKLRGKILQPEISFEIQLAQEDKGIMGGVVDQKLSLLNQDPSSLNKQVFALLVLGRFIQENPFELELASSSTMIRTTVSKFLSAQLNQLSSKVIPGMELNFDIQSYDDYQSGQAEGRTQVEIGLKKQLFNERLSVQIGGTVDVEGEEAKHNSTSDIASDVTIEYKLNKDGSFRLKGFRHDQYEGAIEGQLVETGVGVVYVRDFNSWRRLFKTKPPKSPQGGLLQE
ncbi:MAG: translocation/assembly module TamB domain-containing protein [Prolixibacteraceae bacterium]|nr:translocation/assembly module TamB domain-containing protein [Prolixibacteraceae bacterium]